MIKIQIKSILGKVLFEYEKENNTVKDTVLQAIKENADLSYADLSYAYLSYADLSYADLSYADLSRAYLRSADLSYADLSYANLRSANLRSADLSSAKTDKRYIQVSCIGSAKRMTTYCFEDDKIWCGCFTGTLEEFESKCKETHAYNEQYLKEYLGFINYVKSLK